MPMLPLGKLSPKLLANTLEQAPISDAASFVTGAGILIDGG